MGRKIEMKKIEDVTKCQVTFSKRRSSLMKKANEIAVCCDVDVAFVAFSPSGRVSKFCNKRRIEDLLHRFVNLPPDSRLNHLDNVQRKLDKLKNLDHIKSETSKSQFLDKQIENLELQIKKSGLELQILEANLRDYELDPEQEPSLHLLSWCERNINHSLERVLAKKSALFGDLQTSHPQPSFQMGPTAPQSQNGVSFSSNVNENELNLAAQSSCTAAHQILNKVVDPWMNPYSAKLSESIVQDLLDQANPVPNMPNRPIILQTGTINTSDAQISSFQQPLVVDHALLNFSQQNTVHAWNNNFSSGTFSNTLYNSTQSLSTMPPPTARFTSYGSNMKMPQLDSAAENAINNLSQFANSRGEESSQVNNMNYYGNNSSSNYAHPNKMDCNNINTATHHTDHPEDSSAGDNVFWTSKIQKSNLWEWEDLLLDDNFNFGGFSK